MHIKLQDVTRQLLEQLKQQTTTKNPDSAKGL